MDLIKRKGYRIGILISLLIFTPFPNHDFRDSVGFNEKMVNKLTVSSTNPQTLKIYEDLINSLEREGLPGNEVRFLFLDPRAEFYPQIIYKNIMPPEMDFYSSTLHPAWQVNKGGYEIYEFMKHYHRYLELAEKEYNVEKEAIIAVLFVETKLGKDIGKYSVFNVLSSMALYSEKPSLLDNIDKMINEEYHYLSHDKRTELIQSAKERAIKRALWAKYELYNLIWLHLNTHIDALELIGSYAGAFGYPQFMPSNVLKYGVDADNDGKVDLYSFPDAILSVANFLKSSGWSSGRLAKKSALLKYNYSNSYVSAVIATASSINSLAADDSRFPN